MQHSDNVCITETEALAQVCGYATKQVRFRTWHTRQK